MEIYLNNGQFCIGEYLLAGNYDDGYTVWKTENGEDSNTLYDDISFEKCVVGAWTVDKNKVWWEGSSYELWYWSYCKYWR